MHIRTLFYSNVDENMQRDRDENEPMEASIGHLVVSIVSGDLVRQNAERDLESNRPPFFSSRPRVEKNS